MTTVPKYGYGCVATRRVQKATRTEVKKKKKDLNAFDFFFPRQDESNYCHVAATLEHPPIAIMKTTFQRRTLIHHFGVHRQSHNPSQARQEKKKGERKDLLHSLTLQGYDTNNSH